MDKWSLTDKDESAKMIRDMLVVKNSIDKYEVNEEDADHSEIPSLDDEGVAAIELDKDLEKSQKRIIELSRNINIKG